MKYFVVSDIHSFGDLFEEALTQAKFDFENPNHTLICLGDIFDRGDETLKVYELLKKIPKERLILIQGNHEELFLESLEKDKPDNYDYSNGTVNTFCNIANVNKVKLDKLSWYLNCINENKDKITLDNSYEDYLKKTWKQITSAVKESEVYKWFINSDWKNYYELNNFIFVHSFIPLQNSYHMPIFNNFNYNDYLRYVPDWRTSASTRDWSDATWGCPWLQFAEGLFDEEIKKNKILVCGHWETNSFHKKFENSDVENYEIYFGKNLIGIDGCTNYTLNVNILVIDENFKCFDKKGKELNI